MKWHRRDEGQGQGWRDSKSGGEVPPLSQGSIKAGNTDGGWSVMLIHRHKSGRFSVGTALLHEGRVTHWYPGEFGDCIHVPEEKDAQDPIVEWTECPLSEQLARMLDAIPTWSQELPRVSGVYWFAHYLPPGDTPKLKPVDVTDGKVRMRSDFGDWVDVTEWHSWWAGPILPPASAEKVQNPDFVVQ